MEEPRWQTLRTRTNDTFYWKVLESGATLLAMPTIPPSSASLRPRATQWIWKMQGPDRDSAGYLKVHVAGLASSSVKAKQAADDAKAAADEAKAAAAATV